MKIAIIGSGISGLTAAYYLNAKHDIQIFEKEDYIGGHTHTVDVDDQAIDTGFIVFNDRTYPNFKGLMDTLGVSYRPTEMSFAVRNDKWNLEYNGNNLNTLFADRKNLFRPKFYALILDILKFNKLCKSGDYDKSLTLSQFLKAKKFSKWFCDGYILPMGSAIWSMGLDEMLDFPLEFFVKFFHNHGLLDINNRPQWYTISGGSRNYIPKLTASFKDSILLNTPVAKVKRIDRGIEIELHDGRIEFFDEVIFACHSDEALKLLSDPIDKEKEILGAIKYSKNEVVLHTDTSLLPKRPLAYASWNYLMTNSSQNMSTLTYDMNILQGLTCSKTYCVTLNSTDLINQDKILASFNYSHPVYSKESVIAQQRFSEISGVNKTHFCGAYWANGFHEDGVTSAIRVSNRINGV
jgi:predicted NAD/FAD-binding protein